MEARKEFLDLAEACGARITGKPDGSEPVEVIFSIDAWRAFDAAQSPAAPAGERGAFEALPFTQAKLSELWREKFVLGIPNVSPVEMFALAVLNEASAALASRPTTQAPIGEIRENDLNVFYGGIVPPVGTKLYAVEATAPGDETGWLIEHSGAMPGIEAGIVSWLFVQPKFNGFGAYELGFTHDASKAIRFARKGDAEAMLKMHLGIAPPDWYSKPFSVTEHMWPALATQAPAEPKLPALLQEIDYAKHHGWPSESIARIENIASVARALAPPTLVEVPK